MSPDYLKLTEERDALRRQVAELIANGVSMHKAADRAAKEERAAIVAWLRSEHTGEDTEGWSAYMAMCVERGDHEVKP